MGLRADSFYAASTNTKSRSFERLFLLLEKVLEENLTQ
jgi:hypothetical protein